jgi:hypothetical protein
MATLFGLSRLPARLADNENVPSDANWSERAVTTAAVSAALLVVTLIAIVMGIASGP